MMYVLCQACQQFLNWDTQYVICIYWCKKFKQNKYL